MIRENESPYFPAFDYLRIILASIVVLGHAGIKAWDLSGSYSVQVFFALSGWLIGGILLRSPPSALPKFYFNRAARIWIPYFLSIVLLMLASVLKEPITRKWLEIFFYDLTFVYNIFGAPQLAAFKNAMPLQGTGNGYWSICAEEQFYLLAPFLITIPARIGRTVWFWAVISFIALSTPYWGYFGGISLGVLAAVVRSRVGDWQTERRAIFTVLLGFVILFIATLADLIPYRIGAPFSAICVVLLLAQPGQYSKLGSFLGGVSFPMYLNHWIGIFIAHAIFKRIHLQERAYPAIVSLIFSFLVAVILFVGVDRVVMTHRKKYFTTIRGKVVAVSGFSLLTVGVVGAFLFADISTFP